MSPAPDANLLNRPLFYLTPNDPVTVGQSFEGIFVLGQTGSGKTSGPGATILLSMLQAGYGLLALTTKRGEAQSIRRLAALAGREQHVILFGPDHKHCLNALDYLYHAPSSRGSGITDNVVSAIMSLIDARDRGRGQGTDPFWQDSAKQLLGCAIDLLGIAGETISFPNIAKLLGSAPYSMEEVRSADWQKTSYLNQLVDRATSREGISVAQAIDLEVAVGYWLNEFPRMDDRPRSGVISTVTSMTYPFTKGLATGLFSGETTLTPEHIFGGWIVILDIPVKEYLQAGQWFQVLWKVLFMYAAERRDLGRLPLPAALFIDEAQLFLTDYDPLFQATARSARIATIFLTQNIDSIRARFPRQTGNAEAENLMGNFNLKIFCAQDHVATNEWAAKMIGEEWQTRTSVNTSFGANGGMGAGTNEQRRFLIDPLEFVRLRKGGPENANVVEAVAFRSGRPFAATGANHVRSSFSQDLG